MEKSEFVKAVAPLVEAYPMAFKTYRQHLLWEKVHKSPVGAFQEALKKVLASGRMPSVDEIGNLVSTYVQNSPGRKQGNCSMCDTSGRIFAYLVPRKRGDRPYTFRCGCPYGTIYDNLTTWPGQQIGFLHPRSKREYRLIGHIDLPKDEN